VHSAARLARRYDARLVAFGLLAAHLSSPYEFVEVEDGCMSRLIWDGPFSA